MLPFESTATPVTSPRCRSLGSFSRLGTESNAMTGTCCANDRDENETSNAASQRFMGTSGENGDVARTILAQSAPLARMGAMNGAESLVRTLLASGVDTCFANPGTSEMHFVAAL